VITAGSGKCEPGQAAGAEVEGLINHEKDERDENSGRVWVARGGEPRKTRNRRKGEARMPDWLAEDFSGGWVFEGGSGGMVSGKMQGRETMEKAE